MSVYEILEDENNYYISSELLEGGELFYRINNVDSEYDVSYIIK
jgi:hypothetical protein